MTTKPIDALAKPMYWVKTIRDMQRILEVLAPTSTDQNRDIVKVDLTLSDHALARLSLKEQATYLWALAYKLYCESLRPDYDRWKEWWQVKNRFNDHYKTGCMVIVNDAMMGNRFFQGVGQLISVESEGFSKDYDDYGGPRRSFGNKYRIRLLDGSEITWTNASVNWFPTHSYCNMLREI